MIKKYDPAERAKKKQESRDRDEESLRSGEKTQEQLRKENGWFSSMKFKIDFSKAIKRA